jgi:outer membrane protein TolC
MKFLAASLILAAAIVARAQTNSVREMTLQDCFAEALKHNFDVQYERYAPDISLYNLRGAYAGYDPVLSLSGQHTHNDEGGLLNGSVSTNYSPVPFGTNYVLASQIATNIPGITFKNENSFNTDLKGSLPWGMTYDLNGNVADATSEESSAGSAGVSVTQPLLKNFWIDNTRLAITAAKNDLKQSEQALRAQVITTVTAVEIAYYELIYARENVQVQEEALELAQQQYSDDKSRVDIGTVAQSGGTLEQDEAQVALDRANLIAAQFALVQAQNTLKGLITDNYTSWHDTDISPGTMDAVKQLFDVQDSWSKGMTQRPDLIQAKISVEQQGIQLKYDRNQLFPQLDLTGSYGFNGAGREYSDAIGQVRAGDRPFYSYGAQFSYPLSNIGARNAYKSDRDTEKQLLLKLKQLEQNIMVQIDDGVKGAESAWESVDATKEGRIAAEAALHAEQEKYKVGKSTTFIVLSLQNALTVARNAEIRAIANYNEALATLAQDEGSTLERRQIDFKVK